MTEAETQSAPVAAAGPGSEPHSETHPEPQAGAAPRVRPLSRRPIAETATGADVLWRTPRVVDATEGSSGDVAFTKADAWLAQVIERAFGGSFDATCDCIDTDLLDVRDPERKFAATEDLETRLDTAGVELSAIAALLPASEYDVAHEWFFELPYDAPDVYDRALAPNVARYTAGIKGYTRGQPWDDLPPFVRGLLLGMMEAGEELSRGRAEAILRTGRHAIPGLMAIVEDTHLVKPGMPGEGWAPIHAARLLGEMSVPGAAGPMTRLLAEEDVAIEEEIPPALGKLGLPALVSLRRLVDDPYSDPVARSPAVHAMACLATAHPELRRAAILSLKSLVTREDEDPHLVGKAVLAVAQLRAHEVKADCDAAFKAERVDQQIISPYDFDFAFSQKGHGVAVGLAPAIQSALEKYEPGEAELPKQVPAALVDQTWKRAVATPFLPPPPPKPRYVSPQQMRIVGPNEPCPCGSTKKYKRCHGAK